MKNVRFLFPNVLHAISVMILLQSCTRDNTTFNNNQELTDAPSIKLKAVTVQGLPSPYFEYNYDANGFIARLNHESGFYQYGIEYKNGRISKMINNTLINKDTLLYHYGGTNVVCIDVLTPAHGKTEETVFLYDNANRLIEAAWKKMNTGTVFKKMLFQYNGQNNMSECEVYYELGNGLEKTNTYLFEQFDDKVNLTSNYLLKEAHYLFLPQVRLQQNNPLKAKLSGIANDFEFDYTYQYNDKLPVLKTSLMKQTRGSDAGMMITGVSRYSYY